MRITKELASSISLKMTEKKKLEIQSINKEIIEMAENIMIDLIPKEVLKLFKTHPSYINTTSALQVFGVGLNGEWITLSKNFPNSSSCAKSATLLDKDAIKISSLLNDKSKKSKQREELRKEIESALFALRTFAQVRSQFKEAAIHLPKENCTALIVDINSIRKKL